ncbi:FBP1-like protein, partial [Mya arenaria]
NSEVKSTLVVYQRHYNINECLSNPCRNNGVCSDQVNSYTCACAPGYTGDDCETEIDECSSNSCSNNGQCTDHVNHFTCTCALGYTGTTCVTVAFFLGFLRFLQGKTRAKNIATPHD